MKIRNKYIQAAIFVTVFFVCWNLFDDLYTKYVMHASYDPSIKRDFALPLMIAVGLSYGIFLQHIKKNPPEEKK